jgi:16S rRNA (uracil1498-N3)-methyltransferase
MRVGEAIQITDGAGVRLIGNVSDVQTHSLDVSIESILVEKVPDLEVTLVQALAKGDRDELAVQAATELGALSVIPWQANRSISRWDGPKASKGQARWQSIVNEASKQSLRVCVPKVHELQTSKQFASNISKFDQVLVLDPTAITGIGSLGSLQGKVALVVGPEGGIDETELAAFEAAGAKRIHLGDGILRTSTAGLAAISYLAGVNGLWNRAE